MRPSLPHSLLAAVALGCCLGSSPAPPPPVDTRPVNAPVTLLPDGEFLAKLEGAVAAARKEVLLSTYLFVTRGRQGNAADRFAAALAAAARRGVTVIVVMEEDRGDRDLSAGNRRTGDQLAAAGVKVAYDDPGVKAHAKLAVVDDRFAFIGSHNLTDSALRWNRELSVVVDSPELAGRVEAYIRGMVPGGLK